MKKIFKYIFASVAIMGMLQGCKKGYFDDLIQNPNQVTVPTLQSLLATGTTKAGVNSYTVSNNVTSNYVQYLASPSAASASDTYETINFSGTWDVLYYAMADANELKKLATAQGASEYLGVANALLAYNLIMVNDLWGSAPFTEAFQTNILTPKYDSEQSVYNSTLSLIDQAIVELSKTGATIKLATGSDTMFGGDRTKWLKFAYMLKARQLNKISKKSSYDPAAVLTAVGSSFTSNTDDAGMAVFVTRNFWASIAISNAAQSLGGWLSEQLVDHLNGTTYGVADPRIAKITDRAPVNNLYIGTVNGAGNRLPGANTAKDECYISVNSPWTSNTAPIWIATYAELKFIEAEAALRSNPVNRTRAYAAYLAGITANMNKLGVATVDQTAYLANPAVAVGEANLTLDLIFKEKFVATYLNPEAWNDARRYDYKYKDFTLPVNAVLPTFIRRLDFPLSERSENGANVPADSPRSTNLWWDKP
ncbi:SusD/RagB family nutrient-binding outer membrane lipoprotein [Pedobacter sp.]